MKENIVQFECRIPFSASAGVFQDAIKKRPLKLRIVPFRMFKPTSKPDPHDGSRQPDQEIGYSFTLPGPDPAMGTVIFGAIANGAGSKVMLTSTGNMRGRVVTNSLMKHVLEKFMEKDPTISPDWRTGHR